METLYNASFLVFTTTPLTYSALESYNCHTYFSSLKLQAAPYLNAPNVPRYTSPSGSWTATAVPSSENAGFELFVHNIDLSGHKFAIVASSPAEPGARLVILSRASKQMREVFTTWLEMYFDINVRPASLSSDFILIFIDAYVSQCYTEREVSAVELEYSTGIAECRRITLAFEATDTMLLVQAGEQLSHSLERHIENVSGIRLAKLAVNRAVCAGGILSSEGRVKFISGPADGWREAFVSEWIEKLVSYVLR
ncbi:uncharacterized protein V1518DRAFT_422424 [Limtongia smithiae]|uniref:uncharacterized protein n=1 Tax=Limtongia smithiae TaxID=1125753 RepID=UPI0034CD8417